MADALDNGEQSLETQLQICRTAVSEAQNALEWIQHPRARPIIERFRGMARDYEDVLHNANADPMILKNAAFAVKIASQCADIEAFYEQKLKAAKAALERVQEEMGKPDLVSRITSFMR